MSSMLPGATETPMRRRTCFDHRVNGGDRQAQFVAVHECLWVPQEPLSRRKKSEKMFYVSRGRDAGSISSATVGIGRDA